MKTSNLLPIFGLLLFLSCCSKESGVKPPPTLNPDYRAEWYGNYKGPVFYQKNYFIPDSIAIPAKDYDTSQVTITVSKASGDSSLNITLNYAKWSDITFKDIKVATDGKYTFVEGSGSGRESYSIYLANDSIHYYHGRACGVRCSLSYKCDLSKE